MTRPNTYLIRMAIFLAAVVGVVALLAARLEIAFANNPLLNSLILGVLGLGILWNLRQVLRLSPEVAWLETFQAGPDAAISTPQPRLLAPMANMLAARARGRDENRRLTLSAAATRSLLDSLASRLDESRELSRYMTGLLIFLGLLGTFWGLLLTIGAVGDVISGMSVGSGDVNALFDQLKSGLARPLHGMGTAFSSSMFGLAGALVLGFLDLTAGQAQNRFFNELEEWLASLTRLPSGALGEGDAAIPVYVQALLEQTAENMENLQTILTAGESRSAESAKLIATLAEHITTLTETMRTSQQLMLKIAESQSTLAPALTRLLTELETSRTQSATDLRLLTRTIAGLTEGLPR